MTHQHYFSVNIPTMAYRSRNEISMFCSKEIPLWTIIREFEQVSKPRKMYMEDDRYDANNMKVTLSFQTERLAHQADEIKKRLAKRNKLFRESKKRTPYQQTSPAKDTTEVSKAGQPTVKSKICIVPRMQNETEPIRNRLFCLLPWEGKEQDKDEEFFKHFAQFGPMVYYETIRDKRGRLSYGYVQYFDESDTEKARIESSPIYKATFAEPRKPPKRASIGKEQKFHEKYRQMVDLELYHLHENTCARQTAWKISSSKRSPQAEQKAAKALSHEQTKENAVHIEHPKEKTNANQERESKHDHERGDVEVTQANETTNSGKRVILKMDKTNTYFITRFQTGDQTDSDDKMSVD